MQVDPAAVATQLAQPPPRTVTPELVRACEPPSRPMLLWGGIAQVSVGGGYSLVFTSLLAPWQIITGAVVVLGLGLCLLAAYAVVSLRLRHVLAHGELVAAEVVRVEEPRRTKPDKPVVGRVVYRYSLGGESVTASRRMSWTSSQPVVVGDRLRVCSLPGRARRHVAAGSAGGEAGECSPARSTEAEPAAADPGIIDDDGQDG